MKSSLRTKSGFTLTEMLVVCGIMAFLGSMAVINIVGRSPHYRLDDARLQIISDMRAARQAAVTTATRVEVVFNVGAKTYTIWVDRNRNGAKDSGEETTKALTAYAGMTMAASPSTGSFTPMGTWLSSGSTVTLTLSPVGSQVIYITPSGEVDSDA